MHAVAIGAQRVVLGLAVVLVSAMFIAAIFVTILVVIEAVGSFGN